jgi:cytoskeletal protein CcmA (bactofilin family)
MAEAAVNRPPADSARGLGLAPSGDPLPVLAAGASFTGLLHVHGGARIDGEVDGEIVASDTVWIGESGRVRARIDAPRIVVAGQLEGEIRATARIELRATARVRGALRAPRLVLAEGAFFEGRCRAGEAEPETDAQAASDAISGPATP